MNTNDNQPNNVTAPAPQTAGYVEKPEINPVLADILAEKEPDTISWVKA